MNKKRKLPSKMGLQRCAVGRKMDIVFISGSIEVGCAEFGALENHTKELIDGSLKLPLVMKDMLKLIADIYPSTIHDVDIAAYSVHGDDLQLLVMDCPRGYVSRIRRLEKLSFSSDEGFGSRLAPLLEVALITKNILKATVREIGNAPVPIRQVSLVKPTILPESFIVKKQAKKSSND